MRWMASIPAAFALILVMMASPTSARSLPVEAIAPEQEAFEWTVGPRPRVVSDVVKPHLASGRTDVPEPETGILIFCQIPRENGCCTDTRL